jgi:hypothetical protein
MAVPYGAVLKDGGSLSLARGQIGLFGSEDTTKDGLKAYDNLLGQPKSKHFTLRVGRGVENHSRTGNDKQFSTPQFRIDEIVGLHVSAPQRTEPGVDDVILGYNGIDPDTSIRIEKGDLIPVYVKITGRAVSLLGYDTGSVTVQDYISIDPCPPVNPNMATCAPCDPCEPVSCYPAVRAAVERLRSKQLFGMTKLDELIDITPVDGCEPPESVNLTDVKTYCLEVCDTGDAAALSLIQAQYPEMKVVRVERKGSTSKYQVIWDSVPAAYIQRIASIIKGCENCPASYTAVPGGYVYALSLEDEGADLSTDVEELANAVEGTAIRAEGQSGGAGFYTVVLESKLSDADLSAFIEEHPTATLQPVGEVQSICKNSTVTQKNWTLCGTCKVSTRNYTIDLPDTVCGTGRLAELQASFPELTVTEEGTAGGCSRRYKTAVKTNVVCDECDDIFKDYFTSRAPESYDGYAWVAQPEAGRGTDCLCGIRFRAKPTVIDPGECLLDDLKYEESSVRIQVSAGYGDMEPVENFPVFNNPVSVYYLSRWAPRSHVAGYMREYEDQSFRYFSGEGRHRKLISRVLRNEETLLPEGADQIVDFELTVRPHRYKALSELSSDTLSFHIITYVGYEKEVEKLLNNMAAAAGIEPVKALP